MMLLAFGDASIQFAPDGQCHFDSHRCHKVEDQSRGCSIDVDRGHALAGGAASIGFVDTDVTRPRTAPMIAVVAHVHWAATPPAHHAPLQQCRSFTRRAKGI
jgi:hypothetical protein